MTHYFTWNNSQTVVVCALLLMSTVLVILPVSDDVDLPEDDDGPVIDYGTRAGENWLTGWDYRKSHNVTGATGAGTDYQVKVISYYDGLGNLFYELTDRTTTITGNPTGRHGFHPAHETNISAVNKVVDGSSRTYLGYDSADAGEEIRLYYTDDLNESWTAYSGNPILGPNANWYRTPSVAYDSGTFEMFLSNRTDGRIERWNSTDGITFTYREIVVDTTSEWGKGFVTYNTDESKWFLYYIDIIAAVKKTYLRTATDLADLDSASPSLVYDGTGFWSVTEKDGVYWATAEAGPAPSWTVTTFNSTSPDSGFTETDNSPVVVDDEACPRFLLSPDGSVGYLYSNRIDPTWYQDTRQAIWNMVDLEAHSDTDFDDIRFTDDDGDTELDYWMEDKTDSDHAVFWIEIADDLNSTQTIYIYYGKTGETTTSNGNNTFLLFDHFLGTGLDAGNWTSSGNVSVAGSIVTALDPNTGTSGLFYSSSTYGAYNVSLRSRAKIYNVHYIAFGLRTTSSPIDMATFDKVTAGNYQLRTSNEGTTTTSAIANDANWRVMELYWIEGSAKFLKNESIIGRHTTNIPDEALPVRTAALRAVGGTTAQIDIDWLFVRNYVDSEPWHAAWGSEETFPCPSTIYSIATGDWKTGTTWKDSCIPGTGDTAWICDGHTVTLDDNRTVKLIMANDTSTFQLGDPSPSASVTLTFDDTNWAGFANDPVMGGTFAGKFYANGTETYPHTIRASNLPATTGWRGIDGYWPSTGYEHMVHNVTMYNSRAWSTGHEALAQYSNVTFDLKGVGCACTADFVIWESTATSFFNDIFINGSASNSHDCLYIMPNASDIFLKNFVVTNFSGLGSNHVQIDEGQDGEITHFRNSNFDETLVDYFGGDNEEEHWISQNHKDTPGRYLIGIDYKNPVENSSKSYVADGWDFTSSDNVELLGGNLTINENSQATSFFIENINGHIEVLSGYTLDIGSNLTNNGTMESSGTITKTGGGHFNFYNTGMVWLNNSTVSNVDPNYYYGGFNFSLGKAANSSIADWNLIAGSGDDVAFNVTSDTFGNKDSGIVWHMNITASAGQTVRFHTANLTSGENYTSYADGSPITTITADSGGWANFSYDGWSTRHINLTWGGVAEEVPDDEEEPDGTPTPFTCDFSADVDGHRVFFEGWCSRDDPLIFHWIWDFGDGVVLYGDSSIDHVYSQTGSYNVSLEVIDYEGRTASVSKWITVQEDGLFDSACWLWAIVILIVILAALFVAAGSQKKSKD